MIATALCCFSLSAIASTIVTKKSPKIVIDIVSSKCCFASLETSITAKRGLRTAV